MAIFKLADNYFIVYYKAGSNPDDPNRTREYFKGPNAERDARARNSELGFGHRQQIARKIYQPTFNDLVVLYLESRMNHNTPSTIKGRYHKLKGIILPELGHIQVDRLTRRRIDQYIAKRLRTPVTVRKGPAGKQKRVPVIDANGKNRTIKATTVHRELSDIMAVLAWAVENGEIATNPLVGYKKPKRDDASIRPPSTSEFQRLLEHAAEHLIRAITLSWYAGVRPGAVELLSLRWSDVDFDRRVLFVTSARKGGPVRRPVPFDERFCGVLKKWYQADNGDDNQHIITYRGQPVERLKTAWRTAKRKSGINRRLRLYDLRHAFVTYLLEGGADLKSVSFAAGHSRTDTTTRVYQHINIEQMRDNLSKMPVVIPKNNTGYYRKEPDEDG